MVVLVICFRFSVIRRLTPAPPAALLGLGAIGERFESARGLYTPRRHKCGSIPNNRDANAAGYRFVALCMPYIPI